MKRSIYLIGLLSLIFNFSQGQYIRCATAELHASRLLTDSAYRAYYANIDQKMAAWATQRTENRSMAGPIMIPVVVHILWNTSDQNISDAQVQSQIQVLNEDYSGNNPNKRIVPAPFQSRFGNVNINFCLASRTPNGDWTTGIERKQTSTTSFQYEDESIKYDTAGGLNAWDRTQYLNLWVCNLGGGLLGYTEMPGGPASEDGCVIFYTAFGRGSSYNLLSQYNLGRTATHEIGHWLGLFHVWGDDNGACTGSDYIMDTPNQSNYTFGCPSFPYIDACANSTDDTGCPGDPKNGIMFMNYLDYSDDDCMSMFTVDQVAIMQSVLNGFRASILTSNGCGAPTGIAEVNAASYIGVYPNPAHDIMNIDFHLPSTTVLNVSAYDMLGNKLITSDVYKAGEQNITLNVSTLSTGLYLLVVNTDQGNIVKRFSVVH